MAYIKNIPFETVFPLKKEVEVRAGQVVSKTLAQNRHVSLTLFAFAKGEAINTHESAGDALVLVLEGTGRFTVAGQAHILTAGESLVMPAHKPHAVFAEEDFKMLLTVVFPTDEQSMTK